VFQVHATAAAGSVLFRMKLTLPQFAVSPPVAIEPDGRSNCIFVQWKQRFEGWRTSDPGPVPSTAYPSDCLRFCATALAATRTGSAARWA